MFCWVVLGLLIVTVICGGFMTALASDNGWKQAAMVALVTLGAIAAETAILLKGGC